MLVPAGRTGNLALIDPKTLDVEVIGGFSTRGDFGGGHDDGPTSVEYAEGRLYVTDRTARELVTVDPKLLSRIDAVALAASPDYVRYVPGRRELWVSEPDGSQIEIFALDDAGLPKSIELIPIDNGPESLVIDPVRGRAYTHHWQGSTLAIDLATREIVGDWPNRCASSRGIALDEALGFLFVACSEGTTSVLDVDADGRVLSSVAKGSGFDVIGYEPKRRRLYLAGTSCDCLVTLGVSSGGALSFLGRVRAPGEAHCAAADDAGNAWVCDPDEGRVFRVRDSF